MTSPKKSSIANNYLQKNLPLKKRSSTKTSLRQELLVASLIQTHQKWETQLTCFQFNKDCLKVESHLYPTMLLMSWTKRCIKTQMMRFFRDEEHPWLELLTMVLLVIREDEDLPEPMSYQRRSQTVSETLMKEKMIALKILKATLFKMKAKKMKKITSVWCKVNTTMVTELELVFTVKQELKEITSLTMT